MLDREDSPSTGGLALINARVNSMDADDRVWSAVLVRDGLIAQAGTDAEIMALRNPDEIVEDLDGQTIIPGLIDPHQHFSMAIFEPIQVDCSTPPLDSLGEILERLEQAALGEPPGRWLRGWGFHWSRVGERRSPTRADLDRVAPQNPLILMDASYHGCFVNSLALDMAGIDRHSPPGRAGVIVLDDHGDTEGTLLETAMDRPESLSWTSYVDRDPALALDLVEALVRRQLALGITSITDGLVLPRAAELYRQAEDSDRLPIAFGQLFGGRTFFDPPNAGCYADTRIEASGGGRLRGGMVKIFVDAVHPSPAIDRPVGGIPDAHTGVNYYGRGELADLALSAAEQEMGVAMHALGDCAIDQALDACSAVRSSEAGKGAMLRIEHFVLASREQARRAADLGVLVVTNPGFVDTWGDQYIERWNIDGRPELHVLPLRDLIDAGVVLAAASDYPCDDLNPFHGIWAAVARRSWTGDELHPEQGITPLEALRLATCAAAEASGTAAEDGSIEPGKRANLAVLDRDPLSCPTDELKSVRVLRTYVDGLLAFEDDRTTRPNAGRRSLGTN